MDNEPYRKTTWLVYILTKNSYGTRLACDPAFIVGRITLVRLGLGEIVFGCVRSDEVGLYF